ncbi:hypothetical protein Pelo_12427 [Pelomyxa schiedti]|nr:hypothetical protein Pelo_12427 [Pelomyxa schiedti]
MLNENRHTTKVKPCIPPVDHHEHHTWVIEDNDEEKRAQRCCFIKAGAHPEECVQLGSIPLVLSCPGEWCVQLCSAFLLEFSHSRRKNLFLKSISALLIIPAIVAGGTFNENLVIKALSVATAAEQVEFQFSGEPIWGGIGKAQGLDGLLLQMLRFRAFQIKDLPLVGRPLWIWPMN